MLLVARGQCDTDAAIWEYQRLHFGCATGRECLVELLPLPSPSSAVWNYHKWSSLAWLRSRILYQNQVLLGRAVSIQRRIDLHQPKVVVFYSSTWHRIWGVIARGVWSQGIKGKLMVWDDGGTCFYVIRHPRAESDEYFRQIGEYLRNRHGNQR